jgi:uncharacterized protein YegJ (DUF2314 family)
MRTFSFMFCSGRASRVLAALTSMLAMAGCSRRDAAREGTLGLDAARVSEARETLKVRHVFARPTEAVASFAVLTRLDAARAKRLGADLIARSLTPAECGDSAACGAVADALRDSSRFAIDVRDTATWGLPKGEGLAAITRKLTPEEGRSIPELRTVVIVTARAPAGADAIAARTGYAAAATLARTLGAGALVYDEVVHRIERPTAFAAHAITAPLGTPAFREEHIVVELYEEEDGTARLLTLGMRRFGAPDVEIEGAPMRDGRPLAHLVNELASKLAAGGWAEAPIDVEPSMPVDLVPAPHHEGDPDNVVLRAAPVAENGASLTQVYDAIAASLTDSVVTPKDRTLLEAIAARVQGQWPQVIARWSSEKGETGQGAKLTVKLPFHATTPNGGVTEWMWVEVERADDAHVEGTLANTPSVAKTLALGAPVHAARSDVADYLLTHPDGGTEGGESARALVVQGL